MTPTQSHFAKTACLVVLFAALLATPLVMPSRSLAAAQPTPTKHIRGAVGVNQGKPERSLTNADVIEMLKAGLPESTIILAIQKGSSNLDTSAQALIQLKRHGATQKILDAVLRAETPSSGSRQDSDNPVGQNQEQMSGEEIPRGVILIDGSQRIQLRMSTPSSRVSTGGMMRVVNPLKKVRSRNTLNGNRSQIRTVNSSPIFEVALAPHLNPTDNVVLVQLTVKSDRRELDVGRTTLMGGITTEIRQKDKVPIILEEASDRGSLKVYRVRLSGPLPPGEYAVLYSSGYYDFGVDSN